jgi:hypothetical protein
MKTFMARFVRPNGDRCVLYVLASSAGQAVQDVMRIQGPVLHVNVVPHQLAALFCAKPLPKPPAGLHANPDPTTTAARS